MSLILNLENTLLRIEAEGAHEYRAGRTDSVPNCAKVELTLVNFDFRTEVPVF